MSWHDILIVLAGACIYCEIRDHIKAWCERSKRNRQFKVLNPEDLKDENDR